MKMKLRIVMEHTTKWRPAKIKEEKEKKNGEIFIKSCIVGHIRRSSFHRNEEITISKRRIGHHWWCSIVRLYAYAQIMELTKQKRKIHSAEKWVQKCEPHNIRIAVRILAAKGIVCSSVPLCMMLGKSEKIHV